MNKDLLIKYGKMLYETFGSRKLTEYYLAVAQNNEELQRMIEYLESNSDINPTDMDEYIINLRI